MITTRKVSGALGISLFTVSVGMLPVAASASNEQSLKDQVDELSRRVEVLSSQLDATSREARAEDRADSKWNVTGYMNAGFTSSNADGEEDHFSSGQFNPIFHYQHKDRLFFESELEMETGEEGDTEVDLEYSALNVFLGDRATLVIGKWLSPIGQFQERLHPSWINKLPTAPAGYGHGGIQPLSDVGVQLRGTIPVGGTYMSYVVAVGNGPRGGHHGLELEGFPEDNNSNKSLAGRLGFFINPSLEVGVSWMTAKSPGEEADTGPVTEGDYDLWGVDAAYTKGNWNVRAEYLDSKLSSFYGQAHHTDAATSLIPKTDWKTWYAQAAYRIPDSRLEPVVRYGDFTIDGFFEGDGEKRTDIGLNFWLAPSAAIKMAVERRNFEDPAADDESLVQVQFTYGF